MDPLGFRLKPLVDDEIEEGHKAPRTGHGPPEYDRLWVVASSSSDGRMREWRGFSIGNSHMVTVQRSEQDNGTLDEDEFVEWE